MDNWAFIYTLGPDATEVRTDVIGSPACTLVALGVPSAADAPGVVDGLVARGVQLVELCGAFGPAETAAVQRALAGRVPLGTVTYPCGEAGGLHALFG
jgi:hypothetical protein